MARVVTRGFAEQGQAAIQDFVELLDLLAHKAHKVTVHLDSRDTLGFQPQVREQADTVDSAVSLVTLDSVELGRADLVVTVERG